MLSMTDIKEIFGLDKDQIEQMVFFDYLKPVNIVARSRYWKFDPKEVNEVIKKMDYFKDLLLAREIENEWA